MWFGLENALAFDPRHLQGDIQPRTLPTQDEALRWRNHSARDKVMVTGDLGCLASGRDPPHPHTWSSLCGWGRGRGRKRPQEDGFIAFPPSFPA